MSWLAIRHILQLTLRPVLNPGAQDLTRPVKPEEMRAFGYITIVEAEASMAWLMDRLTPEANEELN
jgi:hypothetical protein